MEKSLITEIFRPLLEGHLMQPTNVAVLLMQADILKLEDLVEITNAQKDGHKAGTSLLLDKLHSCTKTNVYRSFVDILSNTGNQTDQYLSEYIQGFRGAPQQDTEHLQRVIQFHFADLSGNIDSKDILPILTQENVIDPVDSEKILAIYSSEGGTMATVHLLFLLHRCAGPDWFLTFVNAVKTTGNGTLADQLKHDGEKLDPSSSGSGISVTSDQDNSKEVSSGDAVNSPAVQNGEMGSDEDRDEDTSSDSVEEMLDADSHSDTADQSASAEKQEQEDAEKSHDAASPEAATESDATNMLYEDQLEAATPGIEGHNTLVIMPAGAGKTHVGASIIQEHITNAQNRDRCRVVFLIDRTNLVEQQKSLLQRVMKPEKYFKVIGLHGGKMDVSLDEVLKTYNVVVLTAAILEQALTSGKVSLESLTLLVFDECHHCIKLHKYNAIMKKYKQEKHQGTTNSLPQIVGLTASPGTGKAKTQIGAQNHLIQICSNLDADIISKPEKHKDVLLKRVNIPEEIEPILVNGRKDDPLKKQVYEIMSTIEKMINDSPGSSRLSSSTELVPKEKSSQVYKQWLSKLLKESKEKIRDGGQQRFISTCVEYIEDLHDALRINEEVRTKDAVDFVIGKLEERKRQMDLFSEVDWELFRLSMSKKVNFVGFSRDPANANPLLTKLEEQIKAEFKNRPESRALLFCQTRDGTRALKAWIEQTPELQFLCPGRIVGARDMTDTAQNEVLNKFREGKHKMLVATNVAEEGLDVPECNLVFRINYVPSDTGYVQVKGRDRAEDGKSYLIALADSNFEMRELVNKAREDMQNRAVEALCKMPREEFKNLISKQQKQDVQQEKLAEHKASLASALPQGGYTLLCKKCMRFVCASLDIVKYGSHHIVLDDPFCTERARFEHFSEPQTFGDSGDFSNVGKIYCQSCTQDWGVLSIICERKLPVIKMKSFVVRKNDASEDDFDYQKIYKQWKLSPFSVKELTEMDVGSLRRLNIPDYGLLL